LISDVGLEAFSEESFSMIFQVKLFHKAKFVFSIACY
jgi:hypothetical protein